MTRKNRGQLSLLACIQFAYLTRRGACFCESDYGGLFNYKGDLVEVDGGVERRFDPLLDNRSVTYEELLWESDLQEAIAEAYWNTLLVDSQASLTNVRFGKGSYYPEYGNSISAWAMSLIGMHMLLFWDSQSRVFTLLAALMITNGWGSFMFHFTGDGAWGALDANSMTLAAMMMWGFILEQFIKCYVHRQNLGHLPEERIRHRLWMGLSWAVVIVFAQWFNSGARDPHPGRKKSYKNNLFEISFGAPIVLSVALASIVVYNDWIDKEFVDARQRRVAIRRFLFGFIASLVGFISWIANEKLCESAKFFQLFPGHVIWHITMPWGIMNMLCIMCFTQAGWLQKKPHFLQGVYCGRFGSWYFVVMPGFYFRDPKSRKSSSIFHAHEYTPHATPSNACSPKNEFFFEEQIGTGTAVEASHSDSVPIGEDSEQPTFQPRSITV